MILKHTEARALMAEHTEGEPMIRLLPGVNEVDDKQWNLVRPHLQEKLASKVLIEVGATTKKDGKGDVYVGKKLGEFSAQEAEDLVKQTLDIDLLDKWRKAEKREDVRLALALQIEEMKKLPETASKKGQD